MARYTADELIAVIEDLTAPRLTHYVEMRAVRPVLSDGGESFREIDRARIQLLCHLTEDYGLDGDALSLVMQILDEMHGLRGEVQAMMTALAEEPDESRQRIAARIRHARRLD
ncbi:hypothetical protein FQV27_01200 [Paracoccus aurantiacus]|uniref:MerR family transcriptional regulator n=1 Tax=Paracoccus aurantiacus TaxID=2599412 RepID=A0A5C6S804_9RHOB|nr:hypothetical protein [Paracoccus aurantiacus]TXB70520.1 hypothetical protein FQV27_01200 [Paracoccus aurantiacus]